MATTIATELTPTDECFDMWEFAKVVRINGEVFERTETSYTFRDWTGNNSNYSAYDELLKAVGDAVVNGHLVERGDNTTFISGGIWIKASETETVHYCWNRIKFEG